MRFQRLEAWLEWQARLHPKAIDLGLERVAQVWQRLQPQGLGCPAVTVAGTNGKGSSVALLDQILRKAGYRTGCYTSPHLVRYNERIRVYGEQSSDQQICDAFDRIDQARGEIALTYFEFGTLAALQLFVDAKPDLVLLEVGLGGRLDAVNVIDAELAIITAIDIDHTEWLGETREQIALEKAGILRTGRAAVVGDRDPPDSLLRAAGGTGAILYRAGQDFHAEPSTKSWHWHGPVGSRRDLPYPRLAGQVQTDNAAAVLMALACLNARFPVTDEAIRAGLETVVLRGRFQIIDGLVPLILDVAHNVQAACSLADNLANTPCRGRTLAVFGMLGDKDVTKVSSLLAGAISEWHLSPIAGDRGIGSEQLRQRMSSGIPSQVIYCHQGVETALISARERAQDGDRIVIFGSFRIVGAALELLNGDRP